MTIRTGLDVKAIREAKGLTQEMLATMAGVSARSLSRAENGEHVSAETLRCLAAALDVPHEVVAANASTPTLPRRVTPAQWAFGIFFLTFCGSFPFGLTLTVSYYKTYVQLAALVPGGDLTLILAVTLGPPSLAAYAAYDFAKRKEAPTIGAMTRILILACWVNLGGMLALVGYLGSKITEMQGHDDLPSAWSMFNHPIPLLAIALLVLATARTVPVVDGKYRDLMARFLYDRNAARSS